MKKLITTVAVGLFLTACGGGAGGSSAPPANNVAVSFGTLSLVQPSGLDQNNTEGDNIFYDVLAVGDVNMDGNDDILVGLMRSDSNYRSVARTAKPVLLLFNPASNGYVVSEEFKAVTSNHIWPRQGVIADFDGDGRNDIYIGDTGVDGLGTNCGYYNSIVLNKQTGMQNMSSSLPRVWDYSHGVIATDFNRDNKKDLLVLNSPYLINQWNNISSCSGYTGQPVRNKSYVIDGATLSEITLALEQNDVDASGYPPLNLTDAYSREQHVGTSADLNGDGFPDLVMGGSSRITILESNGQQSYSTSQQLPIPSIVSATVSRSTCSLYFNQCDFPYSYVTTLDIDGDGSKEIIASIAYNNAGKWQGQFFQALKKVGSVWTDITAQVFPTQNGLINSSVWCYKLDAVDLNGDGHLDLVCNNLNPSVSEVFWVWKNNTFVPWTDAPSKNGKRYTVLRLATGNHVVSITGSSNITIAGWKI